METILNVSMQGGLLDIVRSVGEPEVIVHAALRQYIMDRALQHLDDAEQRMSTYARRYASDYRTFVRRVATDPTYLNQINSAHPLWEADAIEWAYYEEEAATWRERLQKALLTSSHAPVPA